MIPLGRSFSPDRVRRCGENTSTASEARDLWLSRGAGLSGVAGRDARPQKAVFRSETIPFVWRPVKDDEASSISKDTNKIIRQKKFEIQNTAVPAQTQRVVIPEVPIAIRTLSFVCITYLLTSFLFLYEY